MSLSNKCLSLTVILSTAIVSTGCIVAPPNNNNGSYNSNNSYHPNKIDISHLHDIYEDEAFRRLSAKDFHQVRINESGNTKWLNSRTNQCVEVLAYAGRVSSVVERDLHFCNENSGYNNNSGFNNNSGYNSAPAPVLGQVPPALADMVGAKGGQAEGYLMNNGYVNRRTQGLWAYWQEQSTGGCVAIKTADGRYQTIEYVVPNNCR
jgi:hypothetical protein